jgi:hypothetical protein
VDVARSCATYDVHPWPGSNDVGQIRTYRVAPGTPALPFPHRWLLPDWLPNDEERDPTPGPGIAGRGKYSKGQKFPVEIKEPDHWCGPVAAWLQEATRDEAPPLLWQTLGPSTCCRRVNAPGIAMGFHIDASKIDYPEDPVPVPMTLKFVNEGLLLLAQRMALNSNDSPIPPDMWIGLTNQPNTISALTVFSQLHFLNAASVVPFPLVAVNDWSFDVFNNWFSSWIASATWTHDGGPEVLAAHHIVIFDKTAEVLVAGGVIPGGKLFAQAGDVFFTDVYAMVKSFQPDTEE